MPVTLSIAFGFSAVRGLMLTVGAASWLAKKLRGASTAAERSLLWMVGSRATLVGLAMFALLLAGRREALGWLLLADASLQLFDALHALALRKRAVVVLPALLCLLDAAAGITLVVGARL